VCSCEIAQWKRFQKGQICAKYTKEIFVQPAQWKRFQRAFLTPFLCKCDKIGFCINCTMETFPTGIFDAVFVQVSQK
jgi:hypothetical protein